MRLSSFLEMESVCMNLPEELVTRIVAMMPFPSIFKARSLSKVWRARFSAVSSIDDEVEKCLAKSFQMQVGQWSHKWKTFCPVSFGENLGLAYDKIFRKGSRMPSLHFLPETLPARSCPDLEGPLLCGYESSSQSLFVANILSRNWKQLAPRPHARSTTIYNKKLVRETTLKTYKVIVFCLEYLEALESLPSRRSPSQRWYLQIYDSRVCGWSSKIFDKSLGSFFYFDFVNRDPVFLNGVLYKVTEADLLTVLAFNVQEGKLEKISLVAVADLPNIYYVDLVVCNASLLMVGLEPGKMGYVHVLKIDLASQNLLKVARGPPNPEYTKADLLRPFSDGDSLFLGTPRQLVTYNVKNGVWTDLRWSDFYDSQTRNFRYMSDFESSAFFFQPGLNPFAEV